MTYPISADVSAGQPTYASHYNGLRSDALYLGQAYTDSYKLGEFLARYAQSLTLTYLATNKVRCSGSATNPSFIMIGGCMLRAVANKDTPAGAFTGAAATYYIYAIRTPGSNTFTLSAGLSTVESDTVRTIGTCYWDGANIQQITSYFGDILGAPTPNYDSGWFAVTTGTVYTKVHGLGSVPRAWQLLHSTSSSGTSEQVAVQVVKLTGVNTYYGNIGFTADNAVIETSTDAAVGTLASTRRNSAAGYYRLLCWL